MKKEETERNSRRRSGGHKINTSCETLALLFGGNYFRIIRNSKSGFT